MCVLPSSCFQAVESGESNRCGGAQSCRLSGLVEKRFNPLRNGAGEQVPGGALVPFFSLISGSRENEGLLWGKKTKPPQREPGTKRGNCAVGFC